MQTSTLYCVLAFVLLLPVKSAGAQCASAALLAPLPEVTLPNQ